MAFLTAYLDESKSDPMFVLAGFISTPSSWTRFSREWNKVLKEFQIPYLHMKEFAFSKGPFDGWKEPKRRALLQRFLFLINSPTEPIYSFSCIFNYRLFDQKFPKKFRQQQDHYFFAFQSCLSGIKVLCDRHDLVTENQTIDLVFDEHAEFSKKALEIFSGYKSWATIPFSRVVGWKSVMAVTPCL